jgi:hypothetical protein
MASSTRQSWHPGFVSLREPGAEAHVHLWGALLVTTGAGGHPEQLEVTAGPWQAQLSCCPEGCQGSECRAC